jgi:enoyl-CoA hydratase/carnithine racemase
VTDTVTYELNDHIAVITYNRPDALNAINGDMRRGLNEAFTRFRDEEDVLVTDQGPRVLTAGVPKKVSEIESLMK